MGFTGNHKQNMTVERPAVKIRHINGHFMTLSDEKSGTLLLKGLQNGFSGKIKDNRVLFQLSVRPKANVSCQ